MQVLIQKNTVSQGLTIGKSNERYGVEADAMADQVMQMPVTHIPPVQRKCAECEEEEDRLQMKPFSDSGNPVAKKHPVQMIQMMGFQNQPQPITPVSTSLIQTGLIQRGGGEEETECSTTISSSSCASGDQCATPDRTLANHPAGTRILKVHIDIERARLRDAIDDTALGHTFVELIDSSGHVYTYGFYPEEDTPNEDVRNVAGCVHHPDTTHVTCVEDTVVFRLTEEQFQAALATAQNVCISQPQYGESYTCTSFANDVVAAAGQSLPSSFSGPMTVSHTLSITTPGVDNPNTLLENLRREGHPASNAQGYDLRRYTIAETAAQVVDRYLYIVRESSASGSLSEELLFLAHEMRAIAHNNVQFNEPSRVRAFRESLLNDGRINEFQLSQIMQIVS